MNSAQISEVTEHFTNVANEFVSETSATEKRSRLHESILKSTYLLVQAFGVSTDQFENMRKVKKEKNGGFQKGYVLSEKVLPIDEGASRSKVVRDDKRDTESGAQTVVAETSSEGIRPIPEKLVRDNIPAIIEKQAQKNWGVICGRIPQEDATKGNHPLENYKAKVRVAGRQEMFGLLREKLQEELTEFKAAVDAEDRLEDLGDILEVVEAYRFYLTKL